MCNGSIAWILLCEAVLWVWIQPLILGRIRDPNPMPLNPMPPKLRKRNDLAIFKPSFKHSSKGVLKHKKNCLRKNSRIRIILILGETGSASNDLNLQHSGMILMSCVDLFSTKYCTSITERPRHRTFFVMKAWDPGSGFAVKCKAGSGSAWKECVCETLIFVGLT